MMERDLAPWTETCTVVAVYPREFAAVTADGWRFHFRTDDVSDADRALVVQDAVFYWSMFYEVTDTGRKRKVSELRFRRLGVEANSVGVPKP